MKISRICTASKPAVWSSRSSGTSSGSRRLHVPTEQRGGRGFEMADCDLRGGTRRTRLCPLRVHRAGSRDALRRPSEQAAVAVNIAIMRAFVELRRVATTTKLGQHDQQLGEIFQAL